MLEYFTIASALAVITHGYFALRLCRTWRWRALLIANVALLPGALVLTLRAPPGAAAWAVPLAHVAFADVGFSILLFAALLTRDLVLEVHTQLRRRRGEDPDRRRLLLAALDRVVVAAAGGATVVGYGVAMAQPELRRVRVPVAPTRAPPGWAGMRVAQISDLHVGPTLRRGYVEALVATVNALDPDLVVITGDLVDGFVSQLADQVAPLASLRARHGVFFVTGNHEYFYRAGEWLTALEGLGISVLSNAHALLDHAGATVLLAGLDDPSAPPDARPSGDRALAAAVAAAPAGALRILLAHRPSDVSLATALGFDVQLSGHLHGGQFFPLTLVIAAMVPHVAGLYRVGETWLYVNRGAGYWGPPNRLGARQEITLLELVRG
jgi:hypothetical protein